jgi:hypothetical protein
MGKGPRALFRDPPPPPPPPPLHTRRPRAPIPTVNVVIFYVSNRRLHYYAIYQTAAIVHYVCAL